jgi:hypothetical protein
MRQPRPASAGLFVLGDGVVSRAARHYRCFSIRVQRRRRRTSAAPFANNVDLPNTSSIMSIIPSWTRSS